MTLVKPLKLASNPCILLPASLAAFISDFIEFAQVFTSLFEDCSPLPKSELSNPNSIIICPKGAFPAIFYLLS